MLKDLIKQKEELELALEEIRQRLSEIMIDIEHAIATPVADIRRLQGKEFGAVNITMDGFKITETIPKKVEWDQEIMNNIYDRIHAVGDDPRRWMKVKMEVAEKQFDSFPEDVRAVFMEARTVKPGKPTIKWEVA